MTTAKKWYSELKWVLEFKYNFDYGHKRKKIVEHIKANGPHKCWLDWNKQDAYTREQKKLLSNYFNSFNQLNALLCPWLRRKRVKINRKKGPYKQSRLELCLTFHSAEDNLNCFAIDTLFSCENTTKTSLPSRNCYLGYDIFIYWIHLFIVNIFI